MSDNYKYTTATDENGPDTPVLYINKQIFKMGGQHIRVFDSHMRLLALGHSLGFKLKEQLHVYSDDAKTNEIAYATTHKIFDFNASFIIKSSKDGEVLGGIRRKGLQSEIGQDTWNIYDKDGKEVALLQEPNLKYSLVRKWLLPFFPQTYKITLKDGSGSLILKQTWTPIILRYRVYCEEYPNFTKQISQKYLSTLLCVIAAIEGRE